MKVRKGFVSNSSSSSFVIDLGNLIQDEIELIKSYKSDDCKWSFKVDKGCFVGTITDHSTQDILSIQDYLEQVVKLPSSVIDWSNDRY